MLKRTILKNLILLLLLLSLVAFSGCVTNCMSGIFILDKTLINTDSPYSSDEKFKVHFIDVLQGDSILINLPDGKNMLIDAGPVSTSSKVIEYINSQNITKLDYVIGTHPHSDHIGGFSPIINDFDIGKLYMPKVSHTTKTYLDLLDTIENKGLTVNTAKKGVTILNEDGVEITILSPVQELYNDLNNYSAVIKLKYDETSFLFMGDAEQLIEEELLGDIKADVLKVGHHGSDTSTSEQFLKAVSPEYAVICVGINQYGQPSSDILNRLKAYNIKVYRTDKNGNIIISSNGKEIKLRSEN